MEGREEALYLQKWKIIIIIIVGSRERKAHEGLRSGREELQLPVRLCMKPLPWKLRRLQLAYTATSIEPPQEENTNFLLFLPSPQNCHLFLIAVFILGF